MTELEKKELTEYSKIIAGAIIDKLNEIKFLEKHKEGDDVALFAHALATMAPLLVLSNLAESKFKNVLEFNHFANRLIMKFHKE